MGNKKLKGFNKKAQDKLKIRMKPRRPQRKLQLKTENLLQLKELRNFWLHNKYLISDFDPACLYFFDPSTYKSTRYRNNTQEYNLFLKNAEPIKYRYSMSRFGQFVDFQDDDDSMLSGSSSINFSDFSFNSLSSMTDPLEDL